MTAVRSGSLLLAVLLASVGGLLFGYGTGVIAGALPLTAAEYGLSAWVQGIAVSAALLGAALTAPMSGRLADRFGRLPVIATATALYAAGSGVSALATGAGSLVAGRLLVGLALGATSFAVPLYIAEISPPANRGALVTLNQLMIAIGLLVSYLTAYLLGPAGAWRWMFALGCVPAVVLLAGTFLVPESPDWLYGTGRAERAARAARRLGLPPHETVPRVSPARRGLRAARAESGLRALVLGLAIAALVHFTGLNTAIYYAPTILGAGGLTPSGGYLGAVLVGTCNVVATAVTIVLLDRSGRRTLMIGGLGLMAVTAAAIAAVQSLGGGPAATAVLLCVFITAGSIGPAPVFWVYTAEIYPRSVRGTLMSLATAVHWAADFLVATTFLPLVQRLSLGGAFVVYAAVTAVSAAALWKAMPETRGRTLAEMGDHPRGKAEDREDRVA
ncbi:sugar porter family MFS transporter [Microbispora sp. RL4-1S]|uniref:Sugar porter family MFS transporter n=1 Tax=Microbispora oryzae TaxID=2806554 RepID=A0A940WM29_9ACTN|nr:sugar porter family MFS transporter [Microbispora oryzae]MBP2707986.1 sugar porter family MFS transporter [Microbispora oryzae]